MKYIKREDINPIRMSVNPPEEIVNAEMHVISIGDVYQYVGLGWIYDRKATKEDYEIIPEITD